MVLQPLPPGTWELYGTCITADHKHTFERNQNNTGPGVDIIYSPQISIEVEFTSTGGWYFGGVECGGVSISQCELEPVWVMPKTFVHCFGHQYDTHWYPTVHHHHHRYPTLFIILPYRATVFFCFHTSFSCHAVIWAVVQSSGKEQLGAMSYISIYNYISILHHIMLNVIT